MGKFWCQKNKNSMPSAARHSDIYILISIGNKSASACCPLGCTDFLRQRHQFERGAARAAQSARTAAAVISRSARPLFLTCDSVVRVWEKRRGYGHSGELFQNGLVNFCGFRFKCHMSNSSGIIFSQPTATLACDAKERVLDAASCLLRQPMRYLSTAMSKAPMVTLITDLSLTQESVHSSRT